MNFLSDNPRKLYTQFLLPSLGSALVMSIYSFVDTIAVGQSEGELGSAAMAVISPLYGVLVFLAILCGVGGSVLMSNARGEGNTEKGNACYTAALLVMGALTAVFWATFVLFHEGIFTFFGADQDLMPKVMEYAKWIVWTFPVFIAPTFLGSFIRNDGAPNLVMAAVVIGGCVNMFGDWFLVFPMGMGMEGAAIATVIGTTLQVLIMCTHFFRKSCGLRLVRPNHMGRGIRGIFAIGFGASVLDLGNVVIAIFMNNQIRRYGGTLELAVYGVLAAITPLFQALFCGVGQAIQPLVSTNHGAGDGQRVRAFWHYGLVTVLVMGTVFTALGELLPTVITRLFMDAEPETLAIAPGIFRLYCPLFLFLGMTVLSTYYLQSTLRESASTWIALLRSVIVSGALIFLLPLMLGMSGVWFALPLSEAIVATLALYYIKARAA